VDLQGLRQRHQGASQCAGCHPDQYRDWTTSFHARSLITEGFRKGFGRFVASRKDQGQGGRDVPMACFGCHAPLLEEADDRAVNEVASLVLAGQERDLAGLEVGCVACHRGETGVFQGPIDHPVSNPAHASAYAPVSERAQACAGCHAWVPPAVACSTVYNDWEHSQAAQEGKPCQSCHMAERSAEAASGEPRRTIHAHAFPGGRSADILGRSVELKLDAGFVQDELRVTASIRNLAAHRIPDG
jgi:hypothetical protein